MHTEYEDLVATANEANERSRDNEIELRGVQEKLNTLAARMDTQDESMELARRQVELLNEEVKRTLEFYLRILQYLRECCGQTRCDRQAIGQSWRTTDRKPYCSGTGHTGSFRQSSLPVKS
jgi:hypothetical protein